MSDDSIQRIFSTKKKVTSDGLQVRYLKGDDGRVEVAVIIDEELTAEQLRRAWPDLYRRRQSLLDRQGSDLTKSISLLKLKYHTMRVDQGYSHNALALLINYECLVCFVHIANFMAGRSATGILAAYVAAWNLLDIMGMKEAEIHEWINKGVAEVKQGHAPWPLTSGPVDARRVQDALRQIKRDLASRKLVYSSASPMFEGITIENVLETKDRWTQKAETLLGKLPDNGGLAELHRAASRYRRKKSENPG